MFLYFGKSEPQRSYKHGSYKKKRVYIYMTFTRQIPICLVLRVISDGRTDRQSGLLSRVHATKKTCPLNKKTVSQAQPTFYKGKKLQIDEHMYQRILEPFAGLILKISPNL